MQYCVLYNPLSNNKRGENGARELEKLYPGEELEYRDVTKIADLPAFLDNLPRDTTVILCGGDGTLNRFANAHGGKLPERKLYYYASGSGNDFYNDLGISGEKKPVALEEYLRNLPTVTVNGKTQLFLNGVGFGMDGYCCEEGDRQRKKSRRKTNYTLIALKGLLFAYHPVNATVCVDCVKKEYRRVWLAPAMKGRFYGGGLMIAPGQKRESDKLTLVVVHNCNKYQILGAFPTILTGKHVKFKRIVEVLEGRDITVTFDRPNALQIDGETVLGVTRYHARMQE